MESFADRMCITGEVAPGTIISPEPILDCSWEGTHKLYFLLSVSKIPFFSLIVDLESGCSGGFPKTAWNYAIKSGSTTCTSQVYIALSSRQWKKL